MTRVLAIVGPTAVGKTQAAISVAEAMDAEIVSVDSMQAYVGMDIGTDKPDAGLRERVPHHLLDLFEPGHEVTVEEFQRAARAAIAEITERGRVALLVGGSGLYFRAVVDDLRFPPRAPDVRAALEEEAERLGAAALWERLRGLDPAAAAKIEPRNSRRTVRALEVIELTGRPFSENAAWETYESIYDLRGAGLARPREDLYERIGRRVDRMLDRGLLSEVERLAAEGLSRTARLALGYRQVLEASSPTEKMMRAEIVRTTKRFARRQESWFRADPRIVWFEAADPKLVERLIDFFSSGHQAEASRRGG